MLRSLLKKFQFTTTSLFLTLAFSSCVSLYSEPNETTAYKSFASQKNYPKTYSVYEDPKMLSKASKDNSKIIVDLKTQRLKLTVNGKTAIDTPTTTGSHKKKDRNTGQVKNKATPTGQFKVTEKIKNKKSSIFGKLYQNGKLVYSGDKRKYKGKYDTYKGASLKNWMRLTNGGIGIHASRGIKRYPASNGCIRVPVKIAPKLFASVSKSTPVIVK